MLNFSLKLNDQTSEDLAEWFLRIKGELDRRGDSTYILNLQREKLQHDDPVFIEPK